MGNVVRRWLPLALIALVTALTAYVTRALPSPVTVDLRGLLPFSLEPTADVMPRAIVIVAMPALATAAWILFTTLRTRAALGLSRRLFGDVPEALGNPETVDRIRPTYDTIVLWVVMLILGIHAGMVAAALGNVSSVPRIVSIVLGVSLMGIGNVFPRLRPNLIAGVRTRTTLSDPSNWRAVHRVFGVAFVVAGAATVLVGILAPSFGVMTAVVCLIVACVIAAVGGASAAVTSGA